MDKHSRQFVYLVGWLVGRPGIHSFQYILPPQQSFQECQIGMIVNIWANDTAYPFTIFDLLIIVIS